jgi:hypothetical protein
MVLDLIECSGKGTNKPFVKGAIIQALRNIRDQALVLSEIVLVRLFFFKGGLKIRVEIYRTLKIIL